MKQRQVLVKIIATETIRVKHRKNSLKMNNVIICGATWGILIYMELDFPKVQEKNFFEEQWLTILQNGRKLKTSKSKKHNEPEVLEPWK